ncbi:MAG: radical SAM protein [Gallionellaceae bacterium]|nr:radical SAM protein [Gallionellaceae bacterium]MDD5364468.1 radical SAM protein [Gallionellaceae bacterium]MDD5367291.1 radical SAM protein [Gallionellaceae bacterium]
MSRRVLLVGYEDQDNLGIRYLSSRLLRDGHHTRIVAFGSDPGVLLATIRSERPDVVGFSLIFQYMVPAFADVIRALRAAGVAAHLTIGGHYASFEPEALLERIPELDSVVRFEGEEALAELVAKLDDPVAWRRIDGIAWLDRGKVVLNPPRTAAVPIDDYAEPDRRDIDYRHQALPTASVLASRGCPWQCSFCSIITFYEANGTKGRRRRDPVRVVDEVELLVRERGARLILFQDDDFLAGGLAARTWAHRVADELLRRGLEREMRFKIACRSDEVREAVLEPLVAAGLCHVYLGVESGDEANLSALNKLLKPEVHLRAGEILRRLDLSFDFGFMLLEPWSTLATARNNLEFLRRFTEDGWAVAGFCRTLPYVGTPIERRLREEGRLTGPALEAEYRFLDPLVDLLWDFCLMAFEGRNFGADATWNVLRGLLFDTHLDMSGRPRDGARDAAARALVQASNGIMLDVLENGLDLIEDGLATTLLDPDLLDLARLARSEDAGIRRHLAALERSGIEDSYAALFR